MTINSKLPFFSEVNHGMQILTVDDQDFNDLVASCADGKRLGRYWRQGKAQIVCATPHFMMVLNGEVPNKIAIKPARGLDQARSMGERLLQKEEEKGSKVELSVQ